MQRSLLIIACFFLCTSSIAQQYPFVHYTSRDGLVSNRTRFIFQDSKGLLYISTYGGLSVYDGARFINYTTDNGLVSSMVNQVIEMGDDSLWLIPNANKIQCLVHGQIRVLPEVQGFCPVINHFIKASNGISYAIADEGLFEFKQNRFKRISLTDGNNEVVNLTSAVEWGVWLIILTDPHLDRFGQLILYNKVDHRVRFGRGLPTVYSMCATPRNEILLSTDAGIMKLDNGALAQGEIQYSKDLAAYHIPPGINSAWIYFDSQDNLWLLSGDGVYKVSAIGSTRKFDSGNGLFETGQVSLFEDKEHSMWFSSGNSGINKLVNQDIEMNWQPVPGMLATSISAVKYSDSVWMLDAKTNALVLLYQNRYKIFPVPGTTRFTRVDASAKNIYLMNTYEISRVVFSGDRVSLVPVFNMQSGMSDLWIDKNENLVAISDKVTVICNNGKIISSPLGYLADQACLSGDLFWVATREKKLFVYRIHPDDPDHYLEQLNIYQKELPDLSPRSLVVDQQNRLWIGSRYHGVFCFQYDKGRVELLKQLSTKNGLSDNFISYLHSDGKNIWACSPVGLDKISESNGRYAVENMTMSINLNQQVLYVGTTRSGVHWALGQGGIIRINPEKKTNSSFKPSILFIQITAAGKYFSKLNNGLSLGHAENAISFKVASPTFLDEKSVRYSFFLEGGSNNSWSNPSSQSEINFAGLSAGHYTLKAKAEFLNGSYPEQETAFAFTILPPWWKTWWFRAAIGLLGVALLIVAIRSYYRRKLEKQKLIMEKQQAIEQERTRIAADMHDDLGAGLTKIKYLSEHIIEKQGSGEPVKPELEKLRHFSTELVESMGEIIWATSEKNNLLSNTLYYLRSYANTYCEENDLDCHFEIPSTPKDPAVSGPVRRNLFLLLKECLHNIVKHAGAETVTIEAIANDQLTLIIKDDGRGYTDNGETKGNGLINMKKRVKELNGSIAFENDNGARVTIQLPLS